MPIYEYKAFDSSGGTKSGIVDADTPRDARSRLRADGVHVIDIVQLADKSKGKGSSGASRRIRSGRVDQSQLAIVTRQFATLLSAGIPAVEALRALIDQVEQRDFEKVLRDVREKVTQGDTLAEAMGTHPGYFNDLFVNMVRAGEASGQLDTILTRLAEYTSRQNRLRSRIVSALTYPMVMICVGVLVVVVLMTVVVPKLTSLFSKMGESLPTITRALISVSNFFVGYWWVLLLLVILLVFLMKSMKRTQEGLLRWDRFIMSIPVLGDLIRKTAISRFSTTMATLLRSGVPVLEALKIVQHVVQNAVLSKTVGEVHDSILEGSDISTPLQASGVFPPMVGYMIATGEQSGQLEELLENITRAYDEEIDTATQRLTAVMEPLIIILLAGVVLFVVAAIVIPLMQMGSLTRGSR